MTPHAERRALQIAVAMAAVVPLTAGTAGMILGPAMIEPVSNLSLDSHYRYLSGLLCGFGLAYCVLIPTIEKQGMATRLLALPIILGGLARLIAVFTVGIPSPPMLAALGMELGVVPWLCLWQRRVARRLSA